MSKGTRYTDEFKQEAVNQIVVHGYSVLDVSQRLGVSTKSLYDWQKTFSKPRAKREADKDLQAENARLKRELKRAQQERDILKEAAVFFAGESKSATRL
jgi:transposase